METQTDGSYLAAYFATHGFAAVAPDYLGLGGGPGPHPYMHTATEAGASLDLLKAARTLAGQKQVTLDRRILVTGFSQGGHAAMALVRLFQKDEEFDVAAVAPVSGPFDLEDAELPAALHGGLDDRSATFYLAYWLTSMDRIYNLYDTPTQAFRPPYNKKITKLLDGVVSATSTRSWPVRCYMEKLLTPGYLKQLGKPSGTLLKAIRANDTTCRDLRSGVPVRLFAASGDRDVAIRELRELPEGSAEQRLRREPHRRRGCGPHRIGHAIHAAGARLVPAGGRVRVVPAVVTVAGPEPGDDDDGAAPVGGGDPRRSVAIRAGG